MRGVVSCVSCRSGVFSVAGVACRVDSVWMVARVIYEFFFGGRASAFYFSFPLFVLGRCHFSARSVVWRFFWLWLFPLDSFRASAFAPFSAGKVRAWLNFSRSGVGGGCFFAKKKGETRCPQDGGFGLLAHRPFSDSIPCVVVVIIFASLHCVGFVCR